MGSIFGKHGKITVLVLSGIIQIANLFLGNIVVNEASGTAFSWMALLHNHLFWGIIILNVIYFSSAYASNQKEQKVDEAITEITEKFLSEMYDFVAEEMKQGKYESSNKVLKVLWKIQKRRRR